MHLMQHVRTTYDRLVEKLGPPTYGPNDRELDKSTCEWLIDAHGKVLKALPEEEAAMNSCVSIYDWKTNETPKGQYAWHVGGSDKAGASVWP